MDLNELKSAYDRLITTTSALHNAAELATERRRRLKEEEASILLKYAADPKQLGGNDKAREASIREMTTVARDAVDDAERSLRDLQGRQEIARLQVEHLQWQIRLMEGMPPVIRPVIPPIKDCATEPIDTRQLAEAVLELVGQETVYTDCGGDFPHGEGDECRRDCPHYQECLEQSRRVETTRTARNMLQRAPVRPQFRRED